MGLKKAGMLFLLGAQALLPVSAEPARPVESPVPPLAERETGLDGLPFKGGVLSMDEGAAYLGERRGCRPVGNEEGAKPETVATHVFYGQGELWLAKTQAPGEKAPSRCGDVARDCRGDASGRSVKGVWRTGTHSLEPPVGRRLSGGGALGGLSLS